MENFNSIIKWCNDNAGLLSVVIFIATILIAWFTGIFRFFRKKPDLRISMIPGPNILTMVDLDRKINRFDAKRVAVSLYLRIVNKGLSATSIETVEIKYRSNFLKWQNNVIWKKINYPEKKIEKIKSFYSFMKHLKMTVAKDFKIKINEEDEKVYPFLLQHSNLTNVLNDSFLPVGKSNSGIIYFESEIFGSGFRPKVINNEVEVVVVVMDSYERKYKKTIYVPFVELKEAKNYFEDFGNVTDKFLKETE